MNRLLLLSAFSLHLFLVTSAPAQELKWRKPTLIGVPAERCCAAMVYDPTMRATLLYGGSTYTTLFGDTWTFSHAAGWTLRTPPVSPPPLQGASLAYDPTTRTAVLFGGSLNQFGFNSGDTVQTNQTWTWDGVSWTQQFPPVSPSPRLWNAANGMAFDSQLRKVVLFGGYTYDNGGFVFMNDTWEWDGAAKTWTERFPAHKPSPRAATLAYNEATDQVMFFGGWDNTTAYGDTWTYNGVDWVQQQTATSPQARTDNGLAFDPALKGVLLFGGVAGTCEDCGETRLNDTWLWDGVNWMQLQTPFSPRRRSALSFSFDLSSHGLLLFGGLVADYQFTNTTWFFGF